MFIDVPQLFISKNIFDLSFVESVFDYVGVLL